MVVAVLVAHEGGSPRPAPPVPPVRPVAVEAAAPAQVPAPVAAPADRVAEAAAQVLRGDDPTAVVTELADRRARALVDADPSALALVDAPGSAALAADEELLRQLAAAGSSFSGLAFDVRSVTVQESGADRLVVRAEVVTAEHQVRGAGGTATTVAAGAPRSSRLELVRVAGEWRIGAVG
ncbi:hypothetical protein GTQ99_22860 [Kineococcus sp. T13]|uniref:hypothetical protein n=1 Tax=Kineococcus vitellinus TaxID=2696565 RepID=UPI0014132968|nr:hypothetical protein [Kineococcus vitellinus]NAZ78226.1 hypothetical protein [Kineococcus vitellinus]